MNQSFVAIELSEEESKKFIWFRKYYSHFDKLLNAGFFDIKGGSAIVDFNDSTEISNIKVIHNYHYKA